MTTRLVLDDWLIQALQSLGGSGNVVEVFQRVWDLHAEDAEKAEISSTPGSYDIEWSAHRMRREGKLRPASVSPQGVWELRT